MKRILSIIIFCMILAGCDNRISDKLTSFKEAVNNEDTAALINLVETEEGELTEDEAVAYIKLLNEMYSKDEFNALVD